MVAGFDAHSVLQIFGAALIGGLIGLDRTAVGQVMVSQPVVAGPLTGWILGDPAAGLVVGGVLELIWVLDLPVGTFVPADSTVAAVAATAIAAIGGGGRSDLAVIGFSLFLTTIMVPFTMFADHLMRMRNAQIPDLAMGRDRRPTEARVTGWHLAGIIAFFLKSFTLCLAFIPAGILVLSWFLRAPAPFQRAMVVFILFLPFLGVASMARKLSISSFDRSLLIGFAVGALCVQWLRLPVLAAVALAAAAGWVGAWYRRA